MPITKIVFDFETYYDQEYSLRKMTPVEYILDPRFEIIGCAVKVNGGETFWLEESELTAYVHSLPSGVTALSHNALFDMGIMSWRLGWVPDIMVDTLGIARAMLASKLRSLALSSVAGHLGLGVKGTTVHQVKGMRLAAIKAAGLYDAYVEYSKGDADLCWGIWEYAVKNGFPVSEIGIMDMVLRACIKPRMVLNQEGLAQHLQAVQAAKESLFARTGLADRAELMSNDKLADVLRSLGVEPPTKISLTTGKETYAFAKTDHAFLELEEHPNPDVQAIVSARMGIKSTLEETRTQRLIAISNLQWPIGAKGLLPMPLKYSGAHTHRLSGDWKLNVQNLPSRGTNAIKKAIEALPGEVIVQADASQIEARMAAWFCGAHNMTNQFANKEDVYSTFASTVFGFEVQKAVHKKERFLGKTAVLGLQYNLGWPKFQSQVRIQSINQMGAEIVLTDDEAMKIVNTYRTVYATIPAMWKFLQNMIPRMTDKDTDIPLFIDGVEILRFQYQKIRLPNGLHLFYEGLHFKEDQWWFSYGGAPKTIYGGKMLENIIQALARIATMEAGLRIQKRLRKADIWLNLQVHDSLVYAVPKKLATVVEGILCEEMRRRPVWALGCPLDVESEVSETYG